MRRYAVFDTNVLVSSLLTKRPNTATAKVVDAIALGDVIPLYNQEILGEYDDVLRRAKFPFSEQQIQKILLMIYQFGVAVHPHPTGETLTDMDDLAFYETAMEKRGEGASLITGNIRHFPEREFIVTPAEMVDILFVTGLEFFLSFPEVSGSRSLDDLMQCKKVKRSFYKGLSKLIKPPLRLS